MTADTRVTEAAAQLRKAAESGVPCSPVRTILGTDNDIDIANAVQDHNTVLAIESGRRISGRKIGLTSKAVMAQVGVDQPDFGTLFVDMEYGDGIEISADRLIQPRAEAEVAIVLEHDLNKGEHSFNDIIAATAYALASIEVVDSRIVDWDIRIVDTVADNASCGVYVLGGQPVPLDRVDLRALTMSMRINDVEVSTGEGAACLGHPLQAARWLADTMCNRGTPLTAGDVVMTGALGPMHPLSEGETVVADLGDLGTVTTYLKPRSEDQL